MRERDNNFYMDFEDNGFGGSAMEQNEALANMIQPPAPAKTDYTQALKQQILGQGKSSKWTGQGLGSAEANAADMAKILAGIGITDINQFGPITREVDLYMGEGVDGTPIYQKQTEQTFGNKLTGQAVPNTYSERQTGNFFGGTFEGKGNTGYGVQFDSQGNPIFYTQGASSNDLAKLMADLGPIGQIGLAIATGGLSIPQQIAAQVAVGVLSGQDMGDVIKNAAVSLAVAQIPGTDFMKDVGVEIKNLGLDPAIANTVNNAAQNAAMSATRAALTGQNILDGALKGAAAGGVNGAVGEIVKGIPDFGKLTSTQQKMAINAITGVISGKPMDQILINSAIAAANAEIHGSKTTAGPVNDTGVDKTTVGNFDDTEVTRLEKLGYTKDQIKEYFKGLDNLTEIFDEPPTTLPVDDTTKPADADADVKALEKSGLPTATDDNVVVTAPRGEDGYTDAERESKRIQDFLAAGGNPNDIDSVVITAPKGADGYTDAERESKRLQDLMAAGGDGIDTLTITGPRPPAPQPDEHVFDPTYGGIFKPTPPDPNELVITDKRPPAYLPTDDDFPRTPQPSTPTLPTATAPPAAQPPAAQPPAPTGPGVRIDPVQALQEFYNPFTPTPAKSTPSQTDTGPIQLMTDVFGTNIATAQKTGARGYGFAAGGEIDELLRLLRS